MIDVNHEHFGSAFSLAYNHVVSGSMLQTFITPLTRQNLDSASYYAENEKLAASDLHKLIEAAESSES